ncbi:hypothetical protein A1O1_05130 [Capronia coronata CBS 617.96]|uniref:Alpha N-terminal protein methyltransferase 1 n=1 Tax=Capronia coronata CBS 617.96 TaxID=1182541 RepID=W9YEU6_9EURO|nr:uncharacterized protein A1O1_05130 [Capronia coronata CBS 617.96]EXJ88200.1 hypothetical protein A1O1_05130 [Capronia coronata CBS 617.96]
MPPTKRARISHPAEPQEMVTGTSEHASQQGTDNEHLSETQDDAESTDYSISVPTQVAYWSTISPSVDGMLGGYPQVSRIDLQFSRNFLRKLERLDKASRGETSADASSNQHRYAFEYCLEPGAGIGRVTLNLLAPLCSRIDIIEPVKRFTDVLTADDSAIIRSGQLRRVYNMPLQEWTAESMPSYSAPEERAETGPATRATPTDGYDLIYNQWCLNHLSMADLVSYLTKLIPLLRPGGWIIVKENISTDAYSKDIFDEEDSSVTRSDQNWRTGFEQAGLKLVKTELQTGFPKALGLFPVRMYALRPR